MEKSVRLVWILGIGLWIPMVALLWWHAYQAQNFRQASLNGTWLSTLAAFGGLWSIAGVTLLKKLRTA